MDLHLFKNQNSFGNKKFLQIKKITIFCIVRLLGHFTCAPIPDIIFDLSSNYVIYIIEEFLIYLKGFLYECACSNEFINSFM